MTRAEFDAACRAALREGMTGRWLPSEQHLKFFSVNSPSGNFRVGFTLDHKRITRAAAERLIDDAQ